METCHIRDHAVITSRTGAGRCHVLAPRSILRWCDEWRELRLWDLEHGASAITNTICYSSIFEHLQGPNFMPDMTLNALHAYY